MSAAATARGRPRRAWPRVMLWVVLLLGSAFAVVWRQTRGVDLERALREAQTERALAEAEHLEWVRRAEEANSRVRVVRAATERLGMKLPGDGEIVFLPAPGTTVPAAEALP